MLLIEDGVVVWGSDPLATVEQAGVYATARGWSDWTALTPEQQAVAILDASTYIKASFKAPTYLSAQGETGLQAATIEAARLSLTGPLIGGDAAAQRGRKSVQAGSVRVEYDSASPAALRSSRLALVFALLRSAGVISAGGLAHPLRKA